MQTYNNQDNLCFSFPESWELDKEDTTNHADSVSVVSPEGGFWCVRRELNETAITSVLEQAVKAMQEVYPELEVENTVENIAGEQLPGIDMHFFCLDLTGTASVRILETLSGKYVIFSQAEDEQLEELKPIFSAITTSLIRGSEK
jgi:hypothetical protein